jgi:hypothetical protein
MGVETLRLLIDLLEVKERKHLAIDTQQYQDAASIRDQERILERMVYRELIGHCDENWETFNYKVYDTFICDYILNKYGVNYHSKETIKALVREMKLIELGI